MAALELKDLTNLPSSLPISQIPQTQADNRLCHSQQPMPSFQHRLQPHPAFQKDMKHLSLQQRVAAFAGNDSGYDLMDDSLTDMRWLQRMDAGSDFPGLTHAQCQKKMAAKNSNRALGKDGCRKKLDYSSSKKGTNKPPLSYASLIALAICSTPQRMMTLSSIYRWIEYTFPFYRTPEAKAWKNSIRHNLSIRKSMFMKVFQYPPRRGNGSYWTLLSDGEEELQKAIPLFATLQPPVIDSNSTYHREPSTHTVKSKGKFVPVLPRSDVLTGNHPYFSVGSSLPSSNLRMSSDDGSSQTEGLASSGGEGCGYRGSYIGKHLSEHDYAKSWDLRERDRVIEAGVDTVVELATGKGGLKKGWDDSIQSDESFAEETPKKRPKLTKEAVKAKPSIPISSISTGGIVRHKSSPGSSPSFTTPPKEQDSSLHLLDSSFLTPLKNLAVPDVEIGPISFSPLYANLATPKREGNTGSLVTGNASSHPFFPSPLTPLRTSLDSGIFSPLRSDCLGGMKFSTPTNMSSLSPLADLSAFSSLQPELYSFRVDSSGGSRSATPLRPGSLQGLGLPGLTPPSRK